MAVSALSRSTVLRTLLVAVVAALVATPAIVAVASPPTVPTAPKALVGKTGPGVGQIQLTWKVPVSLGDGISEYELYRSSLPGHETFLTSISASALATIDSGLPDAATFHYKLSAKNVSGVEGPLSNEAYASTPSVPWQPTNVQAALQTSGRISVTWGAPLLDGGLAVTQYKVYRGTASVGETLWRVFASSTLTTSDAICPLAETCYYRVSAVNAVGEGLQSAEASALGVAFNPRAQVQPDGSVVLFNDVNGNGHADAGETYTVIP